MKVLMYLYSCHCERSGAISQTHYQTITNGFVTAGDPHREKKTGTGPVFIAGQGGS
jgi:hypothetical protein